MKQNIYDHPDFFAGYQSLRDDDTGLNGALEEPAMRRVLPNLAGTSILDIGCGFGNFAAYALNEGVSSYLGVDISKRMIDVARSRFKQPALKFINQAIEDLDIEAAAFDVVISSMCFHYVSDYSGIVAKAKTGLRENGVLIFSVEHPICTALLCGWHQNEAGIKLHWPIDRYKDEGKRVSKWFVDDVIKYHRTIETYINVLIGHGLMISCLLEPTAQEEAIRMRPELKEHARRPPVLIVVASKTEKRDALVI